MVQTKKDLRVQGKRNRAAGLRFELKVRADLEAMGWVVSKWSNTVDYEKLKLVPVKPKYNPFRKAIMVMGTGFPDFIAFKKNKESPGHEVIGVEVKRQGYLDRVEKGMAHWLLDQHIFSRLLIAKAKQQGRKTEVHYDDFRTKYMKDDNKI